MILCFDTSGLNRLEDDADREPLIAGLSASGTVLISAYNVAEAASTRSQARRVALLDLMRRLTGDTRILDRPSGLIHLAANAFANSSTDITVNADPNLDGLWVVLRDPDQATERLRQTAIGWLRSTGGDLRRITSAKRNELQEVYRHNPSARPRTVGAALRQYFADRDHMYERFAPRYARATGASIDREAFDRLVAEPLYALHVGAFMYGIYQRAVRPQSYGNKRHASTIDLGQAVYLPMCDRFITDDAAQYRALRLLNCYNTRQSTEVLRYGAFRRRTLGLP